MHLLFFSFEVSGLGRAFWFLITAVYCDSTLLAEKGEGGRGGGIDWGRLRKGKRVGSWSGFEVMIPKLKKRKTKDRKQKIEDRNQERETVTVIFKMTS